MIGLLLGKKKNLIIGMQNNTTLIQVEIKKMLQFLIENIFVVVGCQVFQQSVGIPMGTKCAPLLADLLLYSYEAEFIQKAPTREEEKSPGVAFSSTFRYIYNDVLSITL
jgi:hypothetical protein